MNISKYSANNYIEKKIKLNKDKISNLVDLNDSDNLDEIDNLQDEIELEKLENELKLKSYNNSSQPKNYGNIWSDNERNIILNYMKKNDYTKIYNIYDENIIQKIAKKIERSEYGVKEEIKKMIFNDYIGDYDNFSKLSVKYNIPQNHIKILIKIYLEKYGKNILYPLEIENKILKYQIENFKLRKELKELTNKKN